MEDGGRKQEETEKTGGKRMDFIARFRSDLEETRLLAGVERVIVGVSGGADSTALLLLLSEPALRRETGFPEVLAGHVHHGLRGAEADGDEQFVEELAGSLGIECLVERVDARAEAARLGLSIEAAARRLRYGAFRAWARERNAGAVALGHHLDDQAETVLLRALRGAGTRGLAGIPIERPLFRSGPGTRIIRPLLGWRREQILEYLASRNQPFRTDASNADVTIPRNLIRRDVLPLLERAVHPGATRALARLGASSARLAADLRTLGLRALDGARRDGSGAGIFLDAGGLRSWPPSVIREALVAALDAAAPGSRPPLLTARALGTVLGWLEKGGPASARRELGPGDAPGLRYSLELRRGLLRIHAAPREAPSPAPPADLAEGVPARWLGWEISAAGAEARDWAGPAAWTPPGEQGGALEEWVDGGAVLESGPLTIRSRRRGEELHPLGAPGSKKLKDLFREEGVWPSERDCIPIVAAGARIVWVVGHRIDHRFRIRQETRRAIVLRARRPAGEA